MEDLGLGLDVWCGTRRFRRHRRHERRFGIPRRGGYRRPQRKRVKTKRAMESMQQENDMDWEEENSSERMLRNHKSRPTRAAAAAERAGEGIRGLEQPADRDFNNKLDMIKAEFQLQFKKLRDHVAEEMAKMTAQLTEELSRAHRERHASARRSSQVALCCRHQRQRKHQPPQDQRQERRGSQEDQGYYRIEEDAGCKSPSRPAAPS